MGTRSSQRVYKTHIDTRRISTQKRKSTSRARAFRRYSFLFWNRLDRLLGFWGTWRLSFFDCCIGKSYLLAYLLAVVGGGFTTHGSFSPVPMEYDYDYELRIEYTRMSTDTK